MNPSRPLRIAFDVDDTLIIPSVVTGNRDTPNYETIAVFRWFQMQGCEMFIWSGSGIDWATAWAEKLGLMPCRIIPKTENSVFGIDIAFDDCNVSLAKVNVKVQRIQNSVSRKEWNAQPKNPNIMLCSAKGIVAQAQDIHDRMTKNGVTFYEHKKKEVNATCCPYCGSHENHIHEITTGK